MSDDEKEKFLRGYHAVIREFVATFTRQQIENPRSLDPFRDLAHIIRETVAALESEMRPQRKYPAEWLRSEDPAERFCAYCDMVTRNMSSARDVAEAVMLISGYRRGFYQDIRHYGHNVH